MTRTRHGGKYLSTKEQFEKGDWSVFVEPLDFLILEKLPAEGTSFGGFYQIGTTVRDLIVQFDRKLTASEITARIRALSVLGLIRAVKMAGKGENAWQTTPRGKETLELWKSRQQ